MRKWQGSENRWSLEKWISWSQRKIFNTTGGRQKPFSFSRVHFGHYKAAAKSEYLSRIHALKLSLIAKTGCTPERWKRCLAVMLKKIAGVALVTKQRAILLLEADFNCHNKLIFGKRMLDLAS